MKNRATSWLIWSGILAVIAMEVAFLISRGSDQPAVREDSTAPSKKLTTVAFARSETPPPSVVLASPPSAEIPAANVDALPLEGLAHRVQPVGALRNEALLTFKTP